MEPSGGALAAPQDSERSETGSTPDLRGKEPHGLRMSREAMLDLARRVAELLVERIERLPGEPAWDGEFRNSPAWRWSWMP